MQAKCPHCGEYSIQGNDYAKFLELAEASNLQFLCRQCSGSWKPAPDEQETYAKNLRKLVVIAQ